MNDEPDNSPEERQRIMELLATARPGWMDDQIVPSSRPDIVGDDVTDVGSGSVLVDVDDPPPQTKELPAVMDGGTLYLASVDGDLEWRFVEPGEAEATVVVGRATDPQITVTFDDVDTYTIEGNGASGTLTIIEADTTEHVLTWEDGLITPETSSAMSITLPAVPNELDDLDDVALSAAPVAGSLLAYDSGEWSDLGPGSSGDVLTTTIDGIAWLPPAAAEIDDGVTANDLLRWNGTDWVVMPAPSTSGTFVLAVVDGVMGWIATEECGTEAEE